MKLILDGGIEGIATRADGTIKIILGTQELDPETVAKLFYFNRKHAKVLISDSNITEPESNVMDDFKMPGKAKKSQSQRLRGVLYRYWEMNGKKGNFDEYYEVTMERIITHFKDKLA